MEGSQRGRVASGEQIIKDEAVGDVRFGGSSEKYLNEKVNSGGKEADHSCPCGVDGRAFCWFVFLVEIRAPMSTHGSGWGGSRERG